MSRSAYEAVYEDLRRAVLSGEIPPGTRLYEVELAERMQVSRTPVRESLRRLESDGFAQRVHGGGLVVTPMGVDDLGDIGLFRIEVDGLAARLASARATKADWDHVRSIVERMRDARSDEELAAIHQQVHRAIYAIGFSPRMTAFFDNHLLPYIELTVNVGPGFKADPEGSYRQHLALLRAMSSGEVERAVKASREHAERGLRYAKPLARPTATNGR